MIPSKRLILLFTLNVLIALSYSLLPVFEKLIEINEAYSIQEKLFQSWFVITAGLVFVAFSDLLYCYKNRHVEFSRFLPNRVSVGKWIRINLEIKHQLTWQTNIRIFDHFPDQSSTERLPLSSILKPGHISKTRYLLRPDQRGDMRFGKVQYHIHSRLGLWWVNAYCAIPATTKVYPDFSAIKKYIALGVNERTSQMGIRLRQRRGQGQEFHRLRKYQREDSIRQIDWKATSRKKELISREYQDEQDQQIFFLLDCGRRMRSLDGHLSHFDHALNSMLLLSYVALHQGDAVGLMSFGAPDNIWSNPVKGRGVINSILNSVYNLHPSPNDSNYTAAAEKFHKRHKKRSLVILISNTRNEHMEELQSVLNLLKQRHFVLLVNLKEQIINEIINSKIESFDQAVSHASTFRFIQNRKQKIEGFTQGNVITLDITAKELPVTIVNIYNRLKRSGQL